MVPTTQQPLVGMSQVQQVVIARIPCYKSTIIKKLKEIYMIVFKFVADSLLTRLPICIYKKMIFRYSYERYLILMFQKVPEMYVP